MTIPLFIFLCLKSLKIIYSNCHTRGLLRSHTTPMSISLSWAKQTAIKRRIHTAVDIPLEVKVPLLPGLSPVFYRKILCEKAGKKKVVKSPCCLFPS